MQELAHLFQERSPGPSHPVICIRSGALGAYTLSSAGVGFWTAAYHTDASAVKDPTGAGNAFLGSFAAALLDGCRGETREAVARSGALLKVAAEKASVSASECELFSSLRAVGTC